MQSAVTHILLNCPEIQSYVNLFANTWGNEAICTKFSKWLGNYVKISRNKKTNNSDVYIQGDVDGTSQTIEYYGVIQEIIKMSSSGDGDRHCEYLGVSQTKQAKKKKSRRQIDLEDIAGSISSAPERINYDTHLFAVSFGTADPQQYYLNYRRPVGASSTSQALSSQR
ncbi:hypothetical protein H5410_012093 [Solanum commersonii]|uniref:Uncharacterized protein n=1 Tax=Solanum commersonii TaxID=4109 RepID=A0A9J6ARG2_SOLCO|nr:hypothetical protein H5410_012093 [Solanum commersonii]